MANRWLAPLVFGGIGSVVAFAQTPTPRPTPAPQQTPVFRSSTTVVPVTVTVTDQKGNPITDLTQADFRVYENKVAREIVNFFPEAFVPGGERSEGIGPATRRTFLFVLAGGMFQNVFNALDRTIAFIRTGLEPEDAVGLMAYDRSTPLTTDHESVVRVLERYKRNYDRLYNDMWKATVVTTPALFGTKKQDDPRVLAAQAKVRAEIDTIFDGLRPTRPIVDLMRGMNRVVPTANNAALERVVSGSNGIKLRAGIELLRHVEGEKHLVFMSSGGLAPDDEDAAKRVARPAADARVIIDMIGNYGFSWGSRRVAELTGGYYSSLNYVDKSLGQIDSKSRFSYLLGYTPLNPEQDGGFREVDVKVDRGGVVVRFAMGYYARPEPEPPDPAVLKEILLKARVESALSDAAFQTDIPLVVTAMLLPRMGLQAEVRAELRLDASRMGWSNDDGTRKGSVELRAFCADAKEAVLGEFSERLDFEASEETYAEWLQNGIRRTLRVPIIGTPKYVKVVVYDYGSDRIGSYTFTFREKK